MTVIQKLVNSLKLFGNVAKIAKVGVLVFIKKVLRLFGNPLNVQLDFYRLLNLKGFLWCHFVSLFVESKVILFYIPAIGHPKINRLFFSPSVLILSLLLIYFAQMKQQKTPLSLKIDDGLRAHLQARADAKSKSLHYYAILALKKATGYKEPTETL